MLLSLTFMPALASLLLPKKISETEPLLLRIVKFFYGADPESHSAPQGSGKLLFRGRSAGRRLFGMDRARILVRNLRP